LGVHFFCSHIEVLDARARSAVLKGRAGPVLFRKWPESRRSRERSRSSPAAAFAATGDKFERTPFRTRGPARVAPSKRNSDVRRSGFRWCLISCKQGEGSEGIRMPTNQ
jgi:hypothetical protein